MPLPLRGSSVCVWPNPPSGGIRAAYRAWLILLVVTAWSFTSGEAPLNGWGSSLLAAESPDNSWAADADEPTPAPAARPRAAAAATPTNGRSLNSLREDQPQRGWPGDETASERAARAAGRPAASPGGSSRSSAADGQATGSSRPRLRQPDEDLELSDEERGELNPRGSGGVDRNGRPRSPIRTVSDAVEDAGAELDLEEPLAEVRIEGNTTIPNSEIAKHVKSRPGRPTTPKQIRDDVDALVRTYWFATVDPYLRGTDEGPVLIFRVVERPIVKGVEYKGYKKIKLKYLEGVTNLKVGSPYDVSANRECARRLEQYYHEKGYAFATVELEMGDKKDDREVVFLIHEGPKVKVASVKFEGNSFFSDQLLSMKKRTSTQILWLFGGKYDPSTIPDDIASVKEYYHSLGFFDVKIDYEEQFNDDKSRLTIVYKIDEGVRFRTRNITIAGNQIFETPKLREWMKVKEGDYFSARDLNEGLEKAREEYGKLGRLFAKVERRLEFTEEPGVVDINVEIEEDKVYVLREFRVHIAGDYPHTRTHFVHNTSRIQPGDLANPQLINLTKRRLEGSQVFESGPQLGPRMEISRVDRNEWLQPVDYVKSSPAGNAEEERDPVQTAAGTSSTRDPAAPNRAPPAKRSRWGWSGIRSAKPAFSQGREDWPESADEQSSEIVTPAERDRRSVKTGTFEPEEEPTPSRETSKKDTARIRGQDAEIGFSTPGGRRATSGSRSGDNRGSDTVIPRGASPTTPTSGRSAAKTNASTAERTASSVSNSEDPLNPIAERKTRSRDEISRDVTQWPTAAETPSQAVRSTPGPESKRTAGPSSAMVAAGPGSERVSGNVRGRVGSGSDEGPGALAGSTTVGQVFDPLNRPDPRRIIPGQGPAVGSGVATKPADNGPGTVWAQPMFQQPAWAEDPAVAKAEAEVPGAAVRGQTRELRGPGNLMYENVNPGDPYFNQRYGPPANSPLVPQAPPEFVDIDAYLTEARTGRLMFGVGVNSNAGLVGNIVLSESNFDILNPPTSLADLTNGTAWRGAGQKFRIEAMPGTVVSRYLVDWSDPFFLDSEYNVGVSGFYYNRFFEFWTEDRFGGRIRVGRQLGNWWSVSSALRLESVQISSSHLPRPQILNEAIGDNFLSTARIALANDRRDAAFLPSEGHFMEFAYEQAFNQFNYPRFEIDGQKYWTTYRRPDGYGKHILSLLGNVTWTGDDTPVFERLYAGGFQSFRGFRFRGVSPVDTTVRVGGQFAATGTVEYMFPVLANENIRLVAFSDFGTVDNDVSLDKFRVAVGGGIRLTVPAMGPVPIAFDWAVPIVKQDFDRQQVFSFYVGITR